MIFVFSENLLSSWKEELQNNFCSFLRVFSSQPTKFGKSIFTRFWALLCQPVDPESNVGHFRQFSLWGSALRFFLKTRLPVRKSNLNFCYFLRVISTQPTNFGKSIFNSFWCVLCQPVHPESNISHF